MATQDRSVADAGLGALFDASPATEVHTSFWALTSFLAGIAALLTAPFSITFAVALSLGALGAVLAVAGVADTSRPDVAGRALVALGLCSSLVTLGFLGLRYLDVDNAFGDALLPALRDLLARLNAQVGAG